MMMMALWAIGGLVVGIGLGFVAGSKCSPAVAEAKRLRVDLDRLQQEHDGYRASVNSHFRKTADLVGQMTKSYAAVYDHLAGGARRFCDGATGDGDLSFDPLPSGLAAPTIEAAAEPASTVAAEDTSSTTQDVTASHDADAGSVVADTAAQQDDGEDLVAAAEGAADASDVAAAPEETPKTV